jgi:HEAT repeats
MVRSYWIGPMIVGLAATGVVWGQTDSPAPMAVESRERTLTVQEAQRPAQKCKLLKSWRLSNGDKAYLVQSFTTGEFITIAEIADTSGSSKAVVTKIYHWGDAQTPPTGTPELPNNALNLGDPIARFGKKVPAPVSTSLVHNDLPPLTPTMPLLPATPLVMNKQASPLTLPVPTDTQTLSPAAPMMTKLPDSKPLTPPAPPIPTNTQAISPPAPVTAKLADSKPVTPPAPPVPTNAQTLSPPAWVTTKVADSKPVTPSIAPDISPVPAKPNDLSVRASTSKVPDSDLVVMVPLPQTTDNKPVVPLCVVDNKLMVAGTVLNLPDINPVMPPAVEAEDAKPVTPIVVTKSPELPSVPLPTKPIQPAAPVATLASPTTPPSDWRQSWGRVDVPSNSSLPTPMTGFATPQKGTGGATTAQASTTPLKPANALANSDGFSADVSKPVKADPKLSSDVVLPPYGPVKADLIVNPPPVTKITPPATSAVSDKTQVQVALNTVDNRMPVKPPVQVVSNQVNPPVPSSSLPVVASLPSATSIPLPALPAPPPAPVTPKPTQIPGMQSVAAAMQVQPAAHSVQIVDGPNAFSEPAPPHGQDGSQPQPPAALPPQANGPPMQLPVMIPTAPMDTGISPALANAFTLPGTTRPIPANFGPPAQVPNAFSDGNTGSVSYAVPSQPILVNPQIPLVDRGPVPVRVISVGSPIQGTGNSLHLAAILRDSLYPSQREDAAQALANHDWRAQPQLVDALLKAAKEDPAPMVRAECVHSLAHMGVATLPVVSLCQALKADPDPRVRKEAEQALLALVGSSHFDQTQFRPGAMTTPKP